MEKLIKHIEDCIFNKESGTLLDFIKSAIPEGESPEAKLTELIKAGVKFKGLNRSNKPEFMEHPFLIRLAPKPKRIRVTDDALDSLKKIVIADPLRPIREGVLLDADNQCMVATDATKLVVIATEVEGESRVLVPADRPRDSIRKGTEVDGKFPNYRAVMPEERIICTMPVSELLAISNATCEALKYFTAERAVPLRVVNKEGNGVYFNAKNMFLTLEALALNGVANVGVSWQGESTKALLLIDRENRGTRALVMPIMRSKNALAPFVDLINLAAVKEEKPPIVDQELSEMALEDISAKEFRRCKIVDCSFKKLENVKFMECRMIECSFEGATFENVHFIGCDLSGADFTGCDLSKVVISKGNLDGCMLSKVTIRDEFQPAKIEDCSFNGADLEGVKFLTGKDNSFVGANLKYSLFHSVNLTGANFQDAFLTGSRFEDCILNESNFAGADLTDAEILNVVAGNPDFTNATLVRAKFIGGLLRNACFAYANLQDCDMQCGLDDVNFDEAINYLGDLL